MRFSCPASVVASVFVVVAFAGLAHAYDEPDAVKARFPDPPVH